MERKAKKKHENKFHKNQILNDEIKRKTTIKDLNEYQSQPVLTFENHGSIKKYRGIKLKKYHKKGQK